MSAVTVIISAQYTTMEILIWLQDQTLFLFVALYTVDLRKNCSVVLVGIQWFSRLKHTPCAGMVKGFISSLFNAQSQPLVASSSPSLM